MPGPSLADGGSIGVVVDDDVKADMLLEEPLDRHFGPAVAPGRRRDQPLALIDRAGAGSAHAEDPLGGMPRSARRFRAASAARTMSASGSRPGEMSWRQWANAWPIMSTTTIDTPGGRSGCRRHRPRSG